MKHMTEEELIAYRESMSAQPAGVAEHLAECGECRGELQRIEAVLAALDALPIPDPGEDYGRRVWQKIAPRLTEKPARWWQPPRGTTPKPVATTTSVGKSTIFAPSAASHDGTDHVRNRSMDSAP